MSMDLDFWKYKENVPHDHARVYEKAVCEGELLDELETLPVDEILEAVAAAFSKWKVKEDGKTFEKRGRGSFQISTTPQTIRFDCYGMSEKDLNALMDVPINFGCPLYDPQISVRFDEWTDR